MTRLSLFAGMTLLMALPAMPEIILSGDSSIATGIGGLGKDNATFFKNVLGSGTSVLIQELDSGTTTEGTDMANYYNTLAGVTATQTTNASVTDLSGVNLFISMLPQAAYSSGEITAMKSFLSGGGTLFLIGEASGYVPGGISIPFLNDALAELGSPLSFIAAPDDPSQHDATGAQIASNPLTNGVHDLLYAFTSEVTGGTPLFFTTSKAAFIEVSAGEVSGVPEPAALPVMLLGGAALLYLARRRRTTA